MFSKILFFLFAACLTCGSVIQAQANKPNIILISLDDADAPMFEAANAAILFPNISQLARDGISFNNFHVTTPLCGPSRASLYRGQYASNTGIRVNRPNESTSNGFDGGYKSYRDRGYFDDDLSIWMKDSGYRTMMVGKFLHADWQAWIPPGWDDFRYVLGGRYFGSYVYTNEFSATGKSIQLPADLYRTTYEAAEAIQLISRQVARDPNQPFFLNINPLGPHRGIAAAPQIYEPRMENWWPRLSQPKTADYNEFDITDKQGFLSELPPLSDFADSLNGILYRDRALATRSVDEMVGAIRQHLEDLEIADNTYIFVTSDNGYLLGQHRYQGKGVPIDMATRVPCFVAGPGIPSGVSSDHLIAHFDLAPTIVSLGGSRAPGFIDGRSFERLLTADGLSNTSHHRLALLIENFGNTTSYGDLQKSASMSVRFENAFYTEYADGSREYYDLSNDPRQLSNGYESLSIGEQSTLHSWLRVLNANDRPASARCSVPVVDHADVAIGGALEGIAEHSSGVTSVRLTVFDRMNRTYWNGAQWQDESVQVAAQLDNPGGVLTGWKYESMPGEEDLGSERFAVFVWAFDAGGDFAPPYRRLFQTDRNPPTISVSNLTDAEFQESVYIFGTADDVGGIEVIEIELQNTVTLEYWNGSDFQTQPVSISLPMQRTRSWEFQASLPEGPYELNAIAIDRSGNRSTAANYTFRVR